MDFNADKKMDERIDRRIKEQLRGGGFTTRKITDTPTDNLQATNRRYVNLNGISANRPTASVVGQFYFDTQINKPVWWNGSTFVDATGTPA